MKRRIIFRLFYFNQTSYPTLLNVWEKNKIDYNFEIILAKEIPKLKQNDVLIYSFMTPQIPIIAEEIKTIKSSNILLVGGGPHISGEQDLALKIGFDILFISEGEENFLNFGLELLHNKTIKTPKIYSEPSQSSLSNYLPISKYIKTIPPLELDRGCVKQCKFCSANLKIKSRRNLSSIKKYCEFLKKNDYKRINFISSLGFKTPDILEILNLVKEYCFNYVEFGIFPSEIHPKSISSDLLHILKNHVSNTSITIGAQSASNFRLKKINRSHSVTDLVNTVTLINESGFRANLDFIVGFPEETKAEIDNLFEIIKLLRSKYRVRIHIHYFFPLAGSIFEYNKPFPLSTNLRKKLNTSASNGVISGGWIQNELEVEYYFNWLKINYPEILKKYN